MKKFLLSMVMVLLCVTGVMADGLVPQEQIDQIEKEITTYMQQFDVPGLSVVVVKDGQVAYSQGFGVLEKGKEDKVNTDTIFQIASVSKNFTALAVNQLIERGLININDPVTKYLPWFASKDAENSKNITIRNLLQHTSGVPTSAYGLEIENGGLDRLEEQVKQLQKINLVSKPGEKYQYSNMNYWTLSLIVEKVSGMSFTDYMDKNIFEPLGMTRSCYTNKIASYDNVATGHRQEKGKTKVFKYEVPGTTVAAGGVYTTANDLSKYIAALLNNGTYNGATIVKPETWATMHEDVITVNQRFGYAYGWMVSKDNKGRTYIHHGGDNPNYTAGMCLLPDINAGVAVLANTDHVITHFISEDVASIILGDKPELVKATPTEKQAAMANLLSAVSKLLIAIMLIWLVIVMLGIKAGKYVTFKGLPGVIRLILQVILVPIACICGSIVLYSMPVTAIGAARIAHLYETDLVNSAWFLSAVIFALGVFVGLMGFVKNAAKVQAAKKNTKTKNA